MSKRKDYTGSKFNHITMVSFAHYDKAHGSSMWNCVCDCGTVKLIASKDVTIGRVKTCGKCEYHSKLIAQTRGTQGNVSAGEHKLFNRYLRGALRSSIKWELSLTQFRDMIKGSCGYCNKPPATKLKGSKLVHNHIDRLESTKGYLVDNTATICSNCKSLKGQRNTQSFLKLVSNIYRFVMPN